MDTVLSIIGTIGLIIIAVGVVIIAFDSLILSAFRRYREQKHNDCLTKARLEIINSIRHQTYWFSEYPEAEAAIEAVMDCLLDTPYPYGGKLREEFEGRMRAMSNKKEIK